MSVVILPISRGQCDVVWEGLLPVRVDILTKREKFGNFIIAVLRKGSSTNKHIHSSILT